MNERGCGTHLPQTNSHRKLVVGAKVMFSFSSIRHEAIINLNYNLNIYVGIAYSD